MVRALPLARFILGNTRCELGIFFFVGIELAEMLVATPSMVQEIIMVPRRLCCFILKLFLNGLQSSNIAEWQAARELICGLLDIFLKVDSFSLYFLFAT